MEIVIKNIDLSDNDISEMAPRIMEVLSSRLQGAYMAIAETDPVAPCLRRIHGLTKAVAEVKRRAEAIAYGERRAM